ncbi:MAG: hypothetical protein ABL970_09610 [Nitrospira sp.]
MDATRKALIATGLVMLWGGLAYWQWVALPDPAHLPLANVSGKTAGSARTSTPSGGLRVHLEQLATARTQREATFTTPRNIFAVPGSDGTLSVVGDVAGGQAPEPVTAQMLQQQVASLELAQYRYLGFVRMGESANSKLNMAVLSKNDEVVVGRAGQYLEQHLVVKSVTPESVTLRDLQARIDHTVPLTEDAAVPQPQP